MSIRVKRIKKSLVNPSFDECSICLEEMINYKEIHKLKCNHIFHKKCIFEWLEGSISNYDKYNKYANIPIEGNCPLCREPCNEIMYSKDNKKVCCIIS